MMLYFECYSGISGDMTVGALLDLGAAPSVLTRALDSLQVEGFRTEISRVSRSGLDVCDFNVILEEDNHDHDDGYLYGDKEVEEGHPHRGLEDILNIIRNADMSDNAKVIAQRIFTILGEAESKVHGIPLDEVRFHEVGSADSIVDIVSAAVCVDDLGIEDIAFSDLYEGSGCVRCRHGVIPVPVPAVTSIASEYGIVIRMTGCEGEHVTPTGAAIAAALRTSAPPSDLRIKKVGMGAGKRRTQRSGILRAMILEDGGGGGICKMECNMDDCSGEALGHTMDLLFEAGAYDVHFIPALMKKNRPGYVLTVICSPDDAERMEGIVFRETTTIGVRRVRMERTAMDRRTVKVDTPVGTAEVKVCTHRDLKRYYPECRSIRSICSRTGMSYTEAYDAVREHCERNL